LKTKDMDDRFFFVGRLKEQVIETKDFEKKDGSGSFTRVTLRVVHERVDADTITPRYSFFPIPQDTVRPSSPVGRYLTGMESASTPIDFGGGSIEDTNEILEAPLGTVYVLCQQSVGKGYGDKAPDRFCLPIAKVGFGNDWNEADAKRIIDEARSVTGPNAATKKAPVKAQTIAEAQKEAVAAQSATLPETEAPQIEDWQSQVVNLAIGKPLQDAKRESLAWATQNRTRIRDGAQAIQALARSEFWNELTSQGVIAIDENGLVAAA